MLASEGFELELSVRRQASRPVDHGFHGLRHHGRHQCDQIGRFLKVRLQK